MHTEKAGSEDRWIQFNKKSRIQSLKAGWWQAAKLKKITKKNPIIQEGEKQAGR